ncbi:MAG: T9SS type A sorting domain-containing protein [Sphingobacteriales bacterium]|nr:T9SS type A sorting domain-containing protein [Sphingobacteriales bacterium]MBI3719958.1 T9SS type A sorting domain-containing protein [Sphingobacteriales bacterium]
MKKIFCLILFYIVSKDLLSQTITPSQTNEFCPNVIQTFTITGLPGKYISISPFYAVINSAITVSADSLSISFTGYFIDQNISQRFDVFYKNGAAPVPFNFTKIRSLTFNNPTTCGRIQLTQASVTPAICQNVNIPISFGNVQWNNINDGSCFGSITNYEYQLPVGWKIGNFTSTGNNWYLGTNSVTVTTNLLGGNGQNILIRPSTVGCAAGLANGQLPATISISRANAPLLNVGGATQINIYCGDAGARAFTVTNGAQAACITSYTWQVANKGWYDVNGVLLTSNITNTTPSLTIYPSCNSGTPAQDLSVIIQAGSETLTQTVKVNYSKNAPPSFSISGPNEFCTSANYTIPLSSSCGASILWSLGSLNNFPRPVTLSCTNCQTTTLTKDVGGTTLLQATIHFPACNAPDTTYVKYIGAGTPIFWGWYNSPTNSMQPMNPWKRFDTTSYNLVCGLQMINTITDITANATVTWDGSGNPSTVHWTQNGKNLGFWIDNSISNVDAFFVVTITNSCGTRSIRYWFKSTNNNCSGGGQLLRAMATPNPAASTTTISLADANGQRQNLAIHQIKIVNRNGVVMQVLDLKNGVVNPQINMGNLSTDIYIIQVFDGNQWYNSQVAKQ